MRDCLPEAAADLEQDLTSRNVPVETGTSLLFCFRHHNFHLIYSYAEIRRIEFFRLYWRVSCKSELQKATIWDRFEERAFSSYHPFSLLGIHRVADIE